MKQRSIAVSENGAILCEQGQQEFKQGKTSIIEMRFHLLERIKETHVFSDYGYFLPLTKRKVILETWRYRDKLCMTQSIVKITSDEKWKITSGNERNVNVLNSEQWSLGGWVSAGLETELQERG